MYCKAYTFFSYCTVQQRLFYFEISDQKCASVLFPVPRSRRIIWQLLRQELCCRNRTVFNGPYFPPEDILPTQVRVPDPKQTQHRPGPAMDEQAGPFFNNNNNNSGFPGNIKAPQTVDTGGGEAARSQYNIPGILHFLQHEWARYEVDRAHWDVERAELQVSSPGGFHCRTLFGLLRCAEPRWTNWRFKGCIAYLRLNIQGKVTFRTWVVWGKSNL